MRNKTRPRARKQKQVPANPNQGLTVKKHASRSAGDKNALDGRSHRTVALIERYRGKLRGLGAEAFIYPQTRVSFTGSVRPRGFTY
jgi:hypothetical protein